MTPGSRVRQICAVARLQARRAFFSRRAFWVYLLALFPAAAFVARAVSVQIAIQRFSAPGVVPAAAVDRLQKGETPEQVIRQVGRPFLDRSYPAQGKTRGARRYISYFDGARRTDLVFRDGALERKNSRRLLDFEEDRGVFAAIFRVFYLRLAVFFGCLGIFVNLFRGEMLDRTLHYWMLAPMRREVLLGGKYLAGLLAAVLIFSAGAALCFWAMLAPHSAAEVQSYWRAQGASHLISYMAAAALGCVGYGSVFLAAGLLVRNPILPAAVLLLWENIAGFLPAMLQKISVLYYVQALCPVPVPLDERTPMLVRLFLNPAAPPSAPSAVAGLVALTAAVLWGACRAVRRLEINYGAE